MRNKLIISLFDYSGIMVRPWANHFDTLCVDREFPPGLARTGKRKWIFGGDYCEVYRALLGRWREEDIAFVFSFPPCTDLCASGARWWKTKREEDEGFQSTAMLAVKAAVHLAEWANCGYMIENPVGCIPSLWRKWDHKFDPCDFTGFCPEDNYTKSTCLWTTKDFAMPAKAIDPSLGMPTDKIHKMSGGAKQKRNRSATPLGFALAVFRSNQVATYYPNHKEVK